MSCGEFKKVGVEYLIIMIKLDEKKYINMLEYFCWHRFKSKSQIFQDLFVIYFTELKKNGFFLEIGAADGVSSSNTFLIEKKLNWNGIVCDPLPTWHESLEKNRKCIIDKRCVYESSNLEMIFEDCYKCPGVSGLKKELDMDHNHNLRKDSKSIKVKTVSINDLLEEHNAPKNIDYISIDTEGSEFSILKELDLTKYNVSIFTIEHNFIEEKRNKVRQLLEKNNYFRVLEKISAFDGWYVKKNNPVLNILYK